MESPNSVHLKLCVPKTYHCGLCDKDTGKRSYYHYSNSTILGCVASCFLFPICACSLCSTSSLQGYKEYCLNCNRVIET